MDQIDRARIASEASEHFLKTFEASDSDGLNNVDITGLPRLATLPSESFAPYDRDGLNNVDVSGLPAMNQLKQFLDHPDTETLQRIATETNNPQLLAEVQDEVETKEAEAFVAMCPDYVKDDDNYQLIRDWISQHGLEWTAPNLQKAFRALVRSGQMHAIGAPRNLTQSQKLLVIAAAKSGQIDEAVAAYLDYVFPNAEDNYIDATEFLGDASTLAARNEAVAFVHYHSRPIQDSPEWEKFKRVYFKRRPMLTLADLDACWELFQKQDRMAVRDRMIAGPPESAPTPGEMDQLDDAGIDSLYHKTLRHYAKTAKAGGILV